MLKARLIVWVVSFCAVLSPALGEPVGQDVVQIPTGQQLAGQGLADSAMALYYKPASPASAERLVALARFAHKLSPDARTGWLMAFIARSQGDQAARAEALKSIIDSSEHDYANTVLWLGLVLGQASNAEQKLALLETTIGDEKVPTTVKSFALAKKARLLIDQGQPGLAKLAVKKALKFYSFNSEALLIQRIELGQTFSKVDIARNRLAGIPGDLLSEKPAWQLAGWLSEIGLHSESLLFYKYAGVMSYRREAPAEEGLALAIDFVNATIDAEKYITAIKMAGSLLNDFNGNIELACLAIEASKAAGESELANKTMTQMDEQFQKLSASGELDAEQTLLAAHYYLVIRDDPAAALAIMGSDITGRAADDLSVQRIIGAAEIVSDDPDEASAGRARLGKIMDRDVYSTALVARYEWAKGNNPAARQAIALGLESPRTGPAYRMLKSVARAANIQVENLPGIVKVRQEIESFDGQILSAGMAMGNFLSLTFQPTSEVVSYCEPIEIEVVLSNTGEIAFPLVGPGGGLIQPKVILSAEVKGRTIQKYENFIKVPLSAPLYLEPGQSISVKTRIDLGPMADYLNNNPFNDLKLTINGYIGHVEIDSDDRIISAMSSLPARPAAIVRQGLFSTFGLDSKQDLAGTYQKALGYIVRDIQKGQLSQRQRAARQVGSLLAIARRPRRERYSVPRSVSAVIDELVLVRMLQEVLKDSSPLVRAEMLAALNGVSVNDVILRELGPAIEDPDPLVRFRLAEMIGLSGSSGRKALLTYFVQDGDEMVRQMARAVQSVE